MATEKVSNIPGNFITHRPSWREALVIAKEHAKTDADASYWQHEINAFDRSFDRLWELMRTSPTAEQQVIIDFALVGTAGPFPVVNGRVKLPDTTMQDLVHMLRPTYDAEQAAPKAVTRPLNDDE